MADFPSDPDLPTTFAPTDTAVGGVKDFLTLLDRYGVNINDIGAAVNALGTASALDAGSASGVATLDAGGHVPSAQLPPITLAATISVASQAAMLASGAAAGTLAWRSDTDVFYLLLTTPATTLANWQLIAPPGVTSVDGDPGPAVDLSSRYAPLGSVGGSGLPATLVEFSTLTGATDSAKLASFCTSYSTSGNKKPTLLLDELRDYTFTTQQTIFDGFSMVGGGLRAVDQARSVMPIPQKVKIRCTSGNGWLKVPNGTIFGIYLQGLSFDATTSSANRVLEPNSSCVIWYTTLRDIAYQNGPGIMGSTATQQPVDLLFFDGVWNLNNISDCTWNLAGSDCFLNLSGGTIDSPTSIMGATGCLMNFTNMSKTEVSHLYVTAEQHMAMMVTGSNQPELTISNSTIEGRNTTHPSYGCLIRTSSHLSLNNCKLNFAMSTPASANGGSTLNKGIVHQGGGVLELNGIRYQNATGVATSVPLLYASAADLVMVSNVAGFDTSGSYFKPRIDVPTGTTVINDGSVTVATH